MVDISMCQNKQCPQKANCYRFTATPNEYQQAYMDFQFSITEGCDAFMRNRVKGKLIKP